MMKSIHVFENESALFAAGAERVVRLAQEALAAHGSFHFVLAGGKTPEGLYRSLAQPDMASHIDWNGSHIFFGDERCVPPDHQESNYRMACESLLDRVPLPRDRIHRMAGERCGDSTAAAYAREILDIVPIADGLPRFDLILLGVGTDGHVASLFPGADILDRREIAATVYVEKLNAWRMSLSLPLINNASHVMLLLTGARKAEVVRHALCKGNGTEKLPVQMIAPAGELEWYLDSAAASRLCPEE